MSDVSTTAQDVEFQPWEQFRAETLRWKQGEHLACIGPTNSGKTTMILNLLPLRKYVTFIATKPRDKTANGLRSQGFHKIEKWERLDPRVYPKRLLWPPVDEIDKIAQQRKEILLGLKQIYVDGNWCVVFDELWYVINQLQLEKTVKTYYTQARSLGISIMAGTQRPVSVPLEVYDQSTHLFFWRDNDERNLRRLSGIAWLSHRMLMRVIASLPEHVALYVNTRTGQMVTTIAPIK